MTHVGHAAETRFEMKVDRSGGPGACHLWLASKTGSGYGAFKVKGVQIGAHVFALERKLGRAIDPGKNALHNCPGGDKPLCCNPAHLWEGTTAENNADRKAKGRSAVGSRHPRSKMTEDAVVELRAMSGTVSFGELGRRFGVSNVQARKIALGISRKCAT